jgi:hypothetical protein
MTASALRRMAACIASCVAAHAFVPAALACGLCDEDKVAAVYDHAVIERAHARRHVVVFAMPFASGISPAALAAVQRAAAGAAGVDTATVRISHEPPALSFALDPRVQTPERALAVIARRAAAPGVRLSLLKVVD